MPPPSSRSTCAGQTFTKNFDLPAGGLRIEGKVGDVRIPAGQISFDVYKGSQFEAGDRRPIAEHVMTSDVVVVPEGTYYIVSNYGDANSVVRSDIRVQAGKLTDITVTHRAAAITLKLVDRSRWRSTCQHGVVGAYAGRRRDQGIDRRISARDSRRGRISRHCPQ